MSAAARSRIARRSFTTGFVLLALASAAPARAWLYDQNQNRIDDRIEAVNSQGVTAAFEDRDPAKHQLIGVTAGTPIVYRVYVGYDHHPTGAEALALTATGARVLRVPRHRLPHARRQLRPRSRRWWRCRA